MPAVPIPVACPVAVPLCGSPPPLRVRFGATADQGSGQVLVKSLIAAIIGVPCARPDQGGRRRVKGSGRRGSGGGLVEAASGRRVGPMPRRQDCQRIRTAARSFDTAARGGSVPSTRRPLQMGGTERPGGPGSWSLAGTRGPSCPSSGWCVAPAPPGARCAAAALPEAGRWYTAKRSPAQPPAGERSQRRSARAARAARAPRIDSLAGGAVTWLPCGRSSW